MPTEATIAELLAELNELRVEKGLDPLKSWKASRIDLEKRIDHLDADLSNNGADDPDDSDADRISKIKAAEKRVAAKKKTPAKKKKPTAKKTAKKKKPSGKKRGPQPKNDGKLSVSDVAKAMDMDPKVARAKLRRYGQTAVDGRWPRFTPGSKEHKAMIDLLEKGVRKVEEDEE